MTKSRAMLVGGMLGAVLLLAACRGEGPLDDTDGIISAAVTADGAQAAISSVTPAPFPTTASLPATATLRPTPTQSVPPTLVPPALPPTAVPNRVLFDLGATSYSTSGFVNAGSTVNYAMQVAAGQIMILNVSSPDSNVMLGISGVSDGQTLQSTAAGLNAFRGVAPRSQDYIVQLRATGAGGNFTLGITIPASISFAPGGTSTSVDGNLSAGQRLNYGLRVGGGQLILLDATSPGNDVALGIYGIIDGDPLQRIEADSGTFVGTAAITQDYIISLATLTANTDFTLNVTVPARITFDVGATTTSLDGSVADGGRTDYSLRALAGQTMSVTVTSPGNVVLAIFGAEDGSVLLSSAGGATTFSGVLPSTQDYVIQAISVGGDSGFTLDIEVQ